MDATHILKAEEYAVSFQAAGALLDGDLALADKARGIILFAHGSGSSRHSPRNRFVAERLHDGGFATLLLDLLTTEEEQIDLHTRHLRFDIDLLSQRLGGAIAWLAADSRTAGLAIGLFG